MVADAVETTESYETEEGVVRAFAQRSATPNGPVGSKGFYDAENPLAWMQAADVVDLDEVA